MKKSQNSNEVKNGCTNSRVRIENYALRQYNNTQPLPEIQILYGL